MEREVIGGLVKAASNESSRGSPIPSKTNAPWLRSTEPSESSWASRCTAGKGDLGIFITFASTAGRTFHQQRRSATTSGDVLRGRSQT
jgi:hypothetical protein